MLASRPRFNGGLVYPSIHASIAIKLIHKIIKFVENTDSNLLCVCVCAGCTCAIWCVSDYYVKKEKLYIAGGGSRGRRKVASFSLKLLELWLQKEKPSKCDLPLAWQRRFPPRVGFSCFLVCGIRSELKTVLRLEFRKVAVHSGNPGPFVEFPVLGEEEKNEKKKNQVFACT